MTYFIFIIIGIYLLHARVKLPLKVCESPTYPMVEICKFQCHFVMCSWSYYFHIILVIY